MKSWPCILLPLAAALSLTGCSKSDKAVDEVTPSTGLPGTWQLAELQCYCIPGPLPNERLVLTSSDIAIYQNNIQTLDATYTIGTASLCGAGAGMPALTFARKGASPAMGPAFTHAGYTLNGDTLVLDYGAPCDAPRKTYLRLRH